MPDFIQRIAELIIKSLEGKITDEEKSELEEWKKQSAKNREITDTFNDPQKVAEQLEKFYSYDTKAGWEKITSRHPLHQSKYLSLYTQVNWRKWVAAALIILIAGSFFYFLTKKNVAFNPPVTLVDSTSHNDIKAPLATKATITLGNGKTIILDSMSNGLLTNEGNLHITKINDGSIQYDTILSSTGNIEYNTLTNPRGSKLINLRLSDGSRVWLNSESSLRYPVIFSADKREVEITGEAYFEVAKAPGKKFYVKSANTVTEVLGTHFNINAYADEETIKVTLLEGSVKIAAEKNTDYLKPGQQAQVASAIKVINNVNTEEVIAWKNEMFSFNGADMNFIMRQVERWYNVDVIFRDKITEKFYGDISRNVNVSNLLKMLETTGAVSFKVEADRIEVMNRK